MGFLSKKQCDICNEKIGLLGNKKLEDGNICKNCAKKLSFWFSDRRHTSLNEIVEQLAYRKENEEKVANFIISRRLGGDTMVLIDDSAQRFVVSFTGDLNDNNPDVIDFKDVTDCSFDIDESQTELMQTDKEGREVSYTIRRYEYNYDFYLTIGVNNPYFNEMKFKLNTYKVDGQSRSKYDKYKDAGEAICEALQKPKSNEQNLTQTPEAKIRPAFCPNCGASIIDDKAAFCQSCGSKIIE